MQEAIDQFGLVDLATYLPKRPTPEQLAIMFDMFQASLDGEMYDPSLWAQFYKPFGFESGAGASDDGESSRPAARAPARPVTTVPTTKPVVKEDDTSGPPFDIDPPAVAKETVAAVSTASSGKTPQEILAMIRNRSK
jgi:hypothetical protein